MKNPIEIDAPDLPSVFDPKYGDNFISIRLMRLPRDTAFVFGIPVRDIHDNDGLTVPVQHDWQKELFSPWVEFFTYSGATVIFSEAEGAYLIDSPGSWHSLTFQTFREKTKALNGVPDAFWAHYSSVMVGLHESLTRRVLDGFAEWHPGRDEMGCAQ